MYGVGRPVHMHADVHVSTILLLRYLMALKAPINIATISLYRLRHQG